MHSMYQTAKMRVSDLTIVIDNKDEHEVRTIVFNARLASHPSRVNAKRGPSKMWDYVPMIKTRHPISTPTEPLVFLELQNLTPHQDWPLK